MFHEGRINFGSSELQKECNIKLRIMTNSYFSHGTLKSLSVLSFCVIFNIQRFEIFDKLIIVLECTFMLSKTISTYILTVFRNTYAVFDRDGDGIIKTDEVGHVMRACGLELTEKELQQSLDEFSGEGQCSVCLFTNNGFNNLVIEPMLIPPFSVKMGPVFAAIFSQDIF